MADPASAEARFLIDERLDGVGELHRTTLRRADDALIVEEDGVVVGRISVLALRTVMQRYGRPLEPVLELQGPTLELGTARLRRLRYRAAVDAIGRDYLVWETAELPPAAALSISVAAAVRHLAVAGARRG